MKHTVIFEGYHYERNKTFEIQKRQNWWAKHDRQRVQFDVMQGKNEEQKKNEPTKPWSSNVLFVFCIFLLFVEWENQVNVVLCVKR